MRQDDTIRGTAKDSKVTDETSSAGMSVRSRRPFHGTQDQTSRYEEYLFGRATYAEGSRNQTWSDSTQGRMAIRLISRGVFGAAAFVWGGKVADKQLRNYQPETVKFSLETIKTKPLQLIAKTLDTVYGGAIKAGVRMLAPAGKKEIIANRAVRFRQKAYYHDAPGHEAGRSLGAEMVAVTFDFACASTADATARSVIQLFDPNIQKPWMKDGHFDGAQALKSFGSTAWRIFSKNQGEDWAAAFPYVFQMKWQRNAISKYAPGFKLASDMQVNGASYILGKDGQIKGDYQKWGALDLQARFMGYNWYTLMYREAYDAIGDTFTRWRNEGIHFSMPENLNPITAVASGLAHGARYVAKSAVKSALYMAPSVPFFWVFRTPQSKWRAPLIYDPNELPGVQNAYVHRNPVDMKPEFTPTYGAHEFKVSTSPSQSRVWQGGTHTNGGNIVREGYFGGAINGGDSVARPITPMGGDEAFRWKNQKTLAAKTLNPFGWLSYKTGSVGVRAMDALAAKRPGLAGKLGATAFDREDNLRRFVDASYSYTPYMIAKAEFGLRVDDRAAGGELGEMDKAIYKGIDGFVTLNFGEVGDAIRRVGNLLVNGAEPSSNDEAKTAKTKKEEGAVKNEATPKSSVKATQENQISTLQEDRQKALLHPKIVTHTKDSNAASHADRVSGARTQAQATYLYPESPSIH